MIFKKTIQYRFELSGITFISFNNVRSNVKTGKLCFVIK